MGKSSLLWRLTQMEQRARVVGGVSYSAEATTLFAAMSSQPDSTRKTLIDTCIVALKNGNVWNTLDTLHVLAAHDSQAASLNWKNPATFAVTLTDAPTFAADRGYTTDGSNDSVVLTIAPNTATQYAQNSASFSLWSRTVGQTANTSGSFPAGATLNPRNTSDQVAYRVNQPAADVVANADGTGWFTCTRTGAGATEAFRNGVSLGTTTTASASVGTDVFDLGLVNSAFSARQFAAAAVGSGRNGTVETAFYNALLAYMQGVGAA